MSKTVLFRFLALLIALEVGFIGDGKTQNQLTYKHAPSSGEIFNYKFDLPIGCTELLKTKLSFTLKRAISFSCDVLNGL